MNFPRPQPSSAPLPYWPAPEPVPPRRPRTPRWVAGLDLGQAADYSAFCAVEVIETVEQDKPAKRLQVRSLKRWPLQTAYTQIAADVARFLDKSPLTRCDLVVDETGVGRPVLEMIRKAKPKYRALLPVTITGGTRVRRTGDGDWHVAKVALVSTVQSLLQGRRLQFAAGLAETKTLVQELENYRLKITASLHETFSAREGAHDDLVLSLALACWWGERDGRRLVVF
jgi:hypothetical protein